MATVTISTPTLSNIAAQMMRRWNKALRLALEGKVYATATPGVFRVEGDSGEWFANLNNNTCTCLDHFHRKCFCAHLFAALIVNGHLMAVEIAAELAAERAAGEVPVFAFAVN